MPVGTVAFICLLCCVISACLGFYGGYRLVNWTNKSASERAEQRFNEILQEYSQKQGYIGELNDAIDSLLSQKIQLETQVTNTIGSRVAGLPVHNAAFSSDRNLSREAREAQRTSGVGPYRDDTDEIDFPSAISPSSELFKQQQFNEREG